MNADLEETLEELGPGYRDMVKRMKAPFAQERGFRLGWAAGALAAASVTAFLGLALFFGEGVSRAGVRDGRAVVADNAFMLAHADGNAAVQELIRTQHADGGWGNDFLTRQNAVRLGQVGGVEARLAYRRARRNLRLRGLGL